MLLLKKPARSLKSYVASLRLSGCAKDVRNEGLTFLSASKMLLLERTAQRVAQSHTQGGFYEFGVALGGSGIVLSKIAQAHGRPFHGFDVFGMIPPLMRMRDIRK